MLSEGTKQKAKEILRFLESKLVGGTEITGIEHIDNRLFNAMYALDGLVNGMDEVEIEVEEAPGYQEFEGGIKKVEDKR